MCKPKRSTDADCDHTHLEEIVYTPYLNMNKRLDFEAWCKDCERFVECQTDADFRPVASWHATGDKPVF